MPSRRTFLKQSLGAAGAAMALSTGSFWGAEVSPIIVNHVGFTPGRAKHLLVAGAASSADFTVRDATTNQIAYSGKLLRASGDFVPYLIGDFSELKTTGKYQIEAPDHQPGRIEIDPHIYTQSIRKCISYFAVQRCGDSKTGYHTPCHIDDGKRSDNGEHLDVTGGWHDACDLRRWVDATIYGMIGLSRVVELIPEQLNTNAVIEELQWGNLYFRKMQDPAGFVMNYCGGDDGNRFTDNRTGSEDDRIIHVEPADLAAQFMFVAAQAALARLMQPRDRDYAAGCIESAKRCLTWCIEKRSAGAASSLSAGIIAVVQMHRTLNDEKSLRVAADFASKLIALQAKDAKSAGIAGFFLAAPDRPQPYREIQHGNLPLIALCELTEHFPNHPDAPAWRTAIELHSQYLQTMSDRSAFGTIPFGLYLDRDPGGDRRIGSDWYRWFMKPRDEYHAGDWWVGINAHLASHGIGLLKASHLLGDPKLAQLAQRQLDWIIGVNPFNASTITDIGRNQPALYRPGAFTPPTPQIPGGVMNGIGGTEKDEPVLLPGSYHTCEYWTPMVSYTMWLMAELQRE